MGLVSVLLSLPVLAAFMSIIISAVTYFLKWFVEKNCSKSEEIVEKNKKLLNSDNMYDMNKAMGYQLLLNYCMGTKGYPITRAAIINIASVFIGIIISFVVINFYPPMKSRLYNIVNCPYYNE